MEQKSVSEIILKLSELAGHELRDLAEGVRDRWNLEDPSSYEFGYGVRAIYGSISPIERGTDVMITGFGGSKIGVLKKIREVQPMPLSEAVVFINTLPQMLFQGMSEEEAGLIAQELRAAGAEVELR